MTTERRVVPWNDGLVNPALAIAQTTDSPLRVLAGPGTGKTYSLMRRVSRLLQEGCDPRSILVCTFTRTAATDLKKSLTKLGSPGAEQVNACTIHSYCFSLLQRSQVIAITGRTARPLLQFETRFLLEDIKGGEFGGFRSCKKRLDAFDAAWARLQTEEPGWPENHTDQAFQNQLVGWLRFHEAMLIGELVVEGLAYLRNNPASPLRGVFSHVLVDEYQDLNRADQAFIDMVSEGGTLTVIGDENQSIYSFRYANPEGVTGFADAHPGTHDELLVDCRRCPRVIVDIANSLIRHNTTRINRPLAYLPGNPIGEAHVVQWSSVQGETEGIAQYIKHKIDSGNVQPGSILVLSPRRQFGYEVRNALNRIGVPAHSFFHEQELEGDPRNQDEGEAQQAFCLLSLLAAPADRVALRCWCGFGSSSLNKNAWKRIRKHCEESGETLISTLEKLESDELSLRYTGPVVDRLRRLRSRIAELSSLTGQGLVDNLFPDGEDWASALRTICLRLNEDEFDAQTLLDHLRVNISQPELPADVDYVRVMSLHKSKGLTADMVVVLGCIDGLLPTIDRTLPQAEQDRQHEEQRRLFYVAVTRARQELILSGVTSLPRDLAHRIRARVLAGRSGQVTAIASGFIRELGLSCPTPVRGSDFLSNI